MMALETIRAVNKERADQAKDSKLEPFMIQSQEQIDDFKLLPFPHIGDYIPEGWEVTETYFVDSSGFGGDDELALNKTQFLKKLKVGFGYAITEAGQFQVYVSEFKRV